jgi:type VI secretion system protein ImpF
MAAGTNQGGSLQAGSVQAGSLLDRLTDLSPDARRDARSSPWDEMREFKASICRDLAALLNTRRAEQDFPPGYEEATNSLLSFGVADFTSYNLKNSVEQEKVRRSIERAIREFEPRLTRVTISIDKPDPLRPVLQFQVAALLRTEPADEPVVFGIALHRESRRIGVSGGGQ